MTQLRVHPEARREASAATTGQRRAAESRDGTGEDRRLLTTPRRQPGCAQRERRVEAVGVDGIERREARTSSRQIEIPVGEVVVKKLLYQVVGVEGIAPGTARHHLDPGAAA